MKNYYFKKRNFTIPEEKKIVFLCRCDELWKQPSLWTTIWPGGQGGKVCLCKIAKHRYECYYITMKKWCHKMCSKIPKHRKSVHNQLEMYYERSCIFKAILIMKKKALRTTSSLHAKGRTSQVKPLQSYLINLPSSLTGASRKERSSEAPNP